MNPSAPSPLPPQAQMPQPASPTPANAAPPPTRLQTSAPQVSPSQPPRQAPAAAPSASSHLAAPSTLSSAPASVPSSTKNINTARKVSKLLDITINNTLRDLVVYVDDAVPSFLNGTASSPAANRSGGAQAAVGATTPGKEGRPSAAEEGATVATAAGLRSALEGRVTDMHRDFLRQFEVLCDSFREVSAHVQELNKECATMETALGMQRESTSSVSGANEAQKTSTAERGQGKRAAGQASAAAAAADEQGAKEASLADMEFLVRRVNILQRELQHAQRRQQDIKTFKERYNFGAAEQKILEEGQVDTHYLDVLEQARAVHRQSRRLLLSREYQQSAGAVIESTYNAIMRATEKISRFLLALSVSSAHGGGMDDRHTGSSGGAGGVRDGAGMIGSLSADVPEASSLFLRCAAVLKEENVSQWVKVMEELARVRRASVLRRYFHLLTTGSATTSAGTYRAGSSPNGDADGSGTAQRPLEAELNNPVFFFSALFAWLHQCIVEEDDFLSLFFARGGGGSNDEDANQDEGSASAKKDADGAEGTSSADGSAADLLLSSHTAGINDTIPISQRALLAFIFDGVTKHLRSAFDGVLERFTKASAVLGHSVVTSGGDEARGEGAQTAAATGAAGGATDGASQLGLPSAQPRVPRGLTGGLTRLLFAATGRHIAPSLSRGRGGDGGTGGDAILRRYSNVSSREQQEAVMRSLMHGPFSGLQVCHQLLQLFGYYGAATFLPLLGARASLTVLVVESASVELQRVLQQLVKFISVHLFDSVGGIVHRLQVLRRLSTAYQSSLEMYKSQQAVTEAFKTATSADDGSTAGTAPAPQTASPGTAESGSPSNNHHKPPPSRFVLDFLFKHYNLVMDTMGAPSTAEDSLTNLSRSESSSPSFAPAVGSAGGAGGGTTDPQQQASALELARSLQQLILPASPEVQAMLQLLQQLLGDTERQQQMLAAIKEQHRQQRETSRAVPQTTEGGKDAAGGTHKNAEEEQEIQEAAAMEQRMGEDEPVMYCMTVVQSLLSLPMLLSAQAVASHGLDDPCKCVLELNCFFALRAVLEQNKPLLTQSARQQQRQAEGDAADALVTIVDAEIGRLEDALVGHLAAAAGAYYFRNARLPAPVRTSVVAVNGKDPTEVARQHGMKQQALRSSLYWLYNFYNLIASNGSLPPLPLVPSLHSTTTQQRVHKRATRAVVDEYGAIYLEVETELQAEAAGTFLNADETAAFADMAPGKLAVLMDA